jgi:hypothetical protein
MLHKGEKTMCRSVPLNQGQLPQGTKIKERHHAISLFSLSNRQTLTATQRGERLRERIGKILSLNKKTTIVKTVTSSYMLSLRVSCRNIPVQICRQQWPPDAASCSSQCPSASPRNRKIEIPIVTTWQPIGLVLLSNTKNIINHRG